MSLFGEKADEFTLLTVSESVTNRHTELVTEIDAFMEKHKGKHKNLKILIKRGTPSTQILNTAKDLVVDMIVMGSRGRSGLSRVFFGGTAYQVARKAHCSVLAVRT